MLAYSERKQRSLQRRAVLQIYATLPSGFKQLLDSGFLFGRRQTAQLLVIKVQRSADVDQLQRDSHLRQQLEGGAQYLVTLDDLFDGRGESFGIECAVD